MLLKVISDKLARWITVQRSIYCVQGLQTPSQEKLLAMYPSANNEYVEYLHFTCSNVLTLARYVETTPQKIPQCSLYTTDIIQKNL